MSVLAPFQRRRQSASNPVDLGKFTGGLNNTGDRQTIAENEVVDLMNLEVDLDGSLVTRPPIERADNTYSGKRHMLLGTAVSRAGATLLIIAFPDDNVTRMLELGTSNWFTIASGYAASGFLQYDNQIVMCQPGGAGGAYNLGTGAYNASASMPAMDRIVLFQGRFWGIGVRTNNTETSLYYGKVTNPTAGTSIFDWDAAGQVFLVNGGDGQALTGIIPDPAGLLVLKQASTFRFTYPSSPGGGTLSVVSNTIGSDEKWANAAVDQVVVTFCQGQLYQLTNGRYVPLSRGRITFAASNIGFTQLFERTVSIFANRVIVWFYGTVYAYSLVTETWSTWFSADVYPAQIVQLPGSYTKSAPLQAYASTGANDGSRKRLYRITDTRAAATAEQGGGFDWRVVTRVYDFGSRTTYKRLMWWALSLLSNGLTKQYVVPVDLPHGQVTWDQMAATTWDVLALGTWDNPLVVTVPTEDDVTYPSPTPVPLNLRLRAALKFLGAYFIVLGHVDGLASSSPQRVYSVTPYLNGEAAVAHKVS